MSALPPGVSTVVLDKVSDLEAYVGLWETLAKEAVDPNVFFEPCVLLPSLRAFAGRSELAVVLILGKATPTATKPELWGFFPLERRGAGLEWPTPCYRLWAGDYSYVPTPLIHRAHAPEVMAAFFAWLDGQKRAPALLAIDGLALGSSFHGLLVDELARRRAHVVVRDSYTRALFAPDCDAQTYLARALPGKDRREIQRQRKRLAELGADLVTLRPGDDVESWIEEFLTLEASGWKGRDGSAMACKAHDATFFRQMFRAAFAAERLSSTAYRLQGKPIAMQILLHAGRGAYGFKTCYDETFSRYAPGLHLEIDLIERNRPNGSLRWIDSAAAHYHPLFNRIYTERRCIERWMISTDHTVGLMLSVVPVLRWAKRSFFSRNEAPAEGAPAIKRGRRGA